MDKLAVRILPVLLIGALIASIGSPLALDGSRNTTKHIMQEEHSASSQAEQLITPHTKTVKTVGGKPNKMAHVYALMHRWQPFSPAIRSYFDEVAGTSYDTSFSVDSVKPGVWTVGDATLAPIPCDQFASIENSGGLEMYLFTSPWRRSPGFHYP